MENRVHITYLTRSKIWSEVPITSEFDPVLFQGEGYADVEWFRVLHNLHACLPSHAGIHSSFHLKSQMALVQYSLQAFDI